MLTVLTQYYLGLVIWLLLWLLFNFCHFLFMDHIQYYFYLVIFCYLSFCICFISIFIMYFFHFWFYFILFLFLFSFPYFFVNYYFFYLCFYFNIIAIISSNLSNISTVMGSTNCHYYQSCFLVVVIFVVIFYLF